MASQTVLIHAETFIFIAQPDPPPNGPINFSWFSANNWFTNDSMMVLHHANTIPAPGDTAQINGGVNAAANQIHLDTLILTPNASVSGGDFIVSKVQMHGGSGGGTTSFTGSTVEVLVEMDVLGGSCAFTSSRLAIDFGATCFCGLGGTGQLTFGLSQLFNAGEISFYPNSGSEITGGTNFVNASGGMLVGSSNVYVTASGNFDNSGIVECDTGTFQISASTWSSTTGLAQYRTTSTNAIISFFNSLTIPAGVTNIFEGPGVSQLQNGALIQGLAQIGVVDSNSLQLDPGILEFANTVGGTGTVHVVGPSSGVAFHLPSPTSVLLANPNAGGSLTGLVVNIDAGSQFNFAYVFNSQGLTFDGATINNYGTTTWGGKGSISMIDSAVFNNEPAALFDCQIQNPVIDGTLGNGPPSFGGTFNNFGTFRKSAGTNVLNVAPEFNNNGLLDVESGQVQFYGGTSSGIFNTAPGAELRLGAASGVRTNYLAAGIQFTGTNFVRLNENSAIVLNTDVSLGHLSLENGTLDGPGTLTVSNIFNWTGNSTIQGNGAINIPSNATFNVTSSSGVLVQRTINNFGTTTMSNSSSGFYIGVNTNVTFNNMAGALLQIRNNGGFGFPNPLPVPRPVLNNFGTLQEISSSIAPLAFIITNHGTVLIQSNQLNCYVYDQVAGTTTISSNATLNPQGFVLQGGVVNGAGTIQGTSAAGFLISGGVLSPGNPIGILNMPNGTYTQTVASALSIAIAGTNAGSQFSRLALGGGTLNGTLNVSFTNGFQPSLGDVYYIVSTPSFGGITGTFSQLNGLHASNGVVLVPQYQAFGVSLVAATDPVLTSQRKNGNQFSLSFATTTNLTNIVEYTDSLHPPIWKPLATNTGDGTIKTVIDTLATNATRFYRTRFR